MPVTDSGTSDSDNENRGGATNTATREDTDSSRTTVRKEMKRKRIQNTIYVTV